MRTAVFSTQPYDRQFLDAANAAGHELVYFEPPLNPETAALALGFPAICTFVNDHLTAPLIRKLGDYGLKLIALRCAGFNQVDLAAAHAAGIPVVRVPAYSPHAVAEHAVALILTLNRKTHKAYNRVREGNFSLERLEGFDLFGQTVGVVGTGKIGRVFAGIMRGFGCRVIAYDAYPAQDAVDIQYVSLETVFRDADILSLHCPLTPETRHLVNRETLALMKPGAMLINTGRGGLIDTAAVVEALKHRRLGYLGLDVYEQEESLFFRDLSETIIEDDLISRLLTFPNVLVTAHQAFFTRNALEQIASATLGSISDFEAGRPLAHAVPLPG
ncbi:MAG: 2-hydroxyacid dehydrogenase [Bacteroidia bacterium]|nr:2-hydroxyacid dehydrogenase [Bacteroidia bacterium]